MAITDRQGDLLQSTRYTPFGQILSQSSTIDNPLLYTGRKLDSETGLYYYRARYYDQHVGRFISEDPMGFAAGINFYAYVWNNPINVIDPTGKEGSWLGKLWNLPNTAIGTLWGLAGVPFGADVSFGNNAIQFENHPFMLDGSAITLGNTISYSPGYGPTHPLRKSTYGEHEKAHTLQGELLGPLYLPSNILGMLAGTLFDGEHYGPSNWNERGPRSNPPKPWGSSN